MATKRTNIFIAVLILVIVILAAVMLYAFFIKPQIQGYAVQKQNEGVQIAVNSILLQLQQNGFVQIPLNQNQTLYLVPYNPQQQQAPAA